MAKSGRVNCCRNLILPACSHVTRLAFVCVVSQVLHEPQCMKMSGAEAARCNEYIEQLVQDGFALAAIMSYGAGERALKFHVIIPVQKPDRSAHGAAPTIRRIGRHSLRLTVWVRDGRARTLCSSKCIRTVTLVTCVLIPSFPACIFLYFER